MVNCFKKLKDLGVAGNVSHTTTSYSGTAYLKTCAYELDRMFKTLRDFEFHKGFYPNEKAFLDQLYQSVANEINKHNKR